MQDVPVNMYCITNIDRCVYHRGLLTLTKNIKYYGHLIFPLCSQNSFCASCLYFHQRPPVFCEMYNKYNGLQIAILFDFKAKKYCVNIK